MRAMVLSWTTLAIVALEGLVSRGVPVPIPADSLQTAVSYDPVYDELRDLHPLGDRVARVSDLVLERDAARFELTDGIMMFLSPVNGRRLGVLFQGSGTLRFEPPIPEEREHARRVLDLDSLVVPFTGLVLLTADSTIEELERRLTFDAVSSPEAPKDPVREALEYLTEEKGRYADEDLMRAVMNGERTDLFYAHVVRRGRDALMVRISPYRDEEVQLLRHVRVPGTHDPHAEVVSQFHDRADFGPGGSVRREPERAVTVRHYEIETTISRNAAGDARFAATARVDLDSVPAAGAWLAFYLYPGLEVDSARWESGEAAPFHKRKDNPVLWIQAPPEPRSVGYTVSYRGELIERYGDWFYIRSSAAWYPRSLALRSHATFDLTYHTPKSWVFASVGERTDSSAEGQVVTTRWTLRRPIRNVSFNLGLFEQYTVREEGAPPVTVLYGEGQHRALSQVILEDRGMKERVGSDVANSLKFFQHQFGGAPVERFYATEIPDPHGEAFPGLIHLSWVTFATTSDDGSDEVFRAHEVAHQWWGIGVDFDTYHDQWLSEGFAQFSGLWYLQTARRDNQKYFNLLRQWRDDLLFSRGGADRRREAGPIWLGHRTFRSDQPFDYDRIVYLKGAWVLHMLRVLMLDLNTMREDRFTTFLREFYATHAGGRASTLDLQTAAQRQIGADVEWFFRQWVRGTAIPTYRVAFRAEPAEGGKYRVRLRVVQENVPEDFEMYVPIAIDLGQNRWARMRVHVKGPRSEQDLPLMPFEPKGLRFNELEGVLCEFTTVPW